jgi:hypothetical protein
MKYLVYLTAIATTAITLLVPESIQAQSVVNQGFPPGGYSSTTIYVPSTTDTTTTTTTTQVSPTIDPSNNSIVTSTDSYYGTGSYSRRYPQNRQPTVIFQQNNNIYSNPNTTQPSCTTSVIGSSIPSPVPLDRATGQPCR